MRRVKSHRQLHAGRRPIITFVLCKTLGAARDIGRVNTHDFIKGVAGIERAHLTRVGDQIDHAANRLARALVIASLVIGSSIVMTVKGGPLCSACLPSAPSGVSVPVPAPCGCCAVWRPGTRSV